MGFGDGKPSGRGHVVLSESERARRGVYCVCEECDSRIKLKDREISSLRRQIMDLKIDLELAKAHRDRANRLNEQLLKDCS